MVNSHHMYIEKLNKEYMEVFNTISKYVTASNMDEMRTEETLSEVMDTFLAAQEAGKPVEKVVGKDLQKFCESLCSEKGIKTYILGFFETCHFMFIWYFLTVLLDIHFLFTSLLEGEKINFFTFRSHKDIPSFLIAGIFVLVLLYSINYLKKKFMFTNPKLSKWLMPISFIFVAAVCIILVSFLPDEGSENGPYLWISLIICGVYFIFRRIITKDKRRFKKENRITFNEFLGVSENEFSGVSETFKNDTEEMEMIRFEKMNKRNAKKGKPELTFEQFLDFEEKNCNNWDKKPPFYIAMATGSPVVFTVIVRLMNGFEQTYDMWFFFFIILVVESLVMYGSYKIINSVTKSRLKWIEAKRKTSVTNYQSSPLHQQNFHQKY